MEYDLASFALHLLAMEVAVQRQAEKGLERVVTVIEETAKEELGHYQPSVGPFDEWKALAPATLAHHDAMGVGDSPLLVTGELYASIEHEVHGREAVVGTKLDIGAYQEFGTEKIPPRPFMGPAAFVNKAKIERMMGGSVVSGMMGGNALLGHDISK